MKSYHVSFPKTSFLLAEKKTWVPIPRTSVRREPIYCFAVNVSGVPFVGGSAGQVCHRASVLIVEEAPEWLWLEKDNLESFQAAVVKYQDKCQNWLEICFNPRQAPCFQWCFTSPLQTMHGQMDKSHNKITRSMSIKFDSPKVSQEITLSLGYITNYSSPPHICLVLMPPTRSPGPFKRPPGPMFPKFQNPRPDSV